MIQKVDKDGERERVGGLSKKEIERFKERVSVCWTKSYSVREEHTETLNVNSREDRWTSYGR